MRDASFSRHFDRSPRAPNFQKSNLLIARILLLGVPFLLVNLALDLYVWRHFRLGFPHWSSAQRRRVYLVYGVLQASWYVALPLLGAWGYEALPAWFRNTFQTYVLMAVASKVWALPWWFLQDLKGLCNKGFLKRLRPVPSHSVHSGNQDDGPDNTMDLSTPEGGEAEPLTRAAFLSRLGFLLGSVPLLGLGGSALSGTAYRYQVHRIKISLPGLAPSWLESASFRFRICIPVPGTAVKALSGVWISSNH